MGVLQAGGGAAWGGGGLDPWKGEGVSGWGGCLGERGLQDEHGIMGVRLNKDIVQVRVKGGWEGVWGGRESTGRRA